MRGNYGFACLLVLIVVEISSSELLPSPLTGYTSPINNIIDSQSEKTQVKFSFTDIKNSLRFGKSVIERLERLETNLKRSGIEVKNGTAAHLQNLDSYPEDEALRQGKEALISAKASIYLMNSICNRLKTGAEQCAQMISSVQAKPNCVKSTCMKEELSEKYRSITGSCNHPSDRDLGEAFTEYSRLLFPAYQDGIHTTRRSVKKRHELPSARVVSSTFVQNEGKLHQQLTMAVAQWGQFIGHDLYHTTSSKMLHSGESIQCCTQDGNKILPRYNHPLCSPIVIPPNDVFYSKHNQRCMTYVRSLPAVKSDCSLGPLEQLNQATHYLDGSQIYGTDYQKSKSLRSGNGGKLKMSSKNLLPLEEDPVFNCPNSNSCYKAGDSRVNSQPQLTAMHTLWNREHNRLASLLNEINPHWDDEKLFQEARRISIAELQHITYNEWLPNVIGEKRLVRLTKYTSFLDEINPSVSNGFATAAFRFLKSLLSSKLNLADERRNVLSNLRLAESFNNPEFLSNGKLDYLLRGLSSQRMENADFHYTEDVTNLMYGNGKSGLDIVSLDIQRGRDHGLPSYTKFRELCGLKTVQKFEDFTDYIPKEDVIKLSKIYKHPSDVDLFVGGILEAKDNGLLGPTFSCILADQFLRTRTGDRFFYSFIDQPHSFTKRQLNEIRKVTLARIFCDNGDEIQSMQNNAFHIINKRNNLVQCNSTTIPGINLEYWKE